MKIKKHAAMAAAFSMALNLSACFRAEENIDVVTYGPPPELDYITSNDDDMIPEEEDSTGETVSENETEEDPAISDEEASDDEADTEDDTEETVSEESEEDEDTEEIIGDE